ncbi:hypothetical protein J7U46_08830 [Pelomonas sp. V22]|uniref:hypothetical protein n=1 Tax=Pelomonas sp. V22 TaxID=2822139 RepID=UPI0024A89F94|nr:hypothetical protein [Pelomonas sp. V22]MDI4633148.1 hypothetical protein [Pelomonas sp. V22]
MTINQVYFPNLRLEGELQYRAAAGNRVRWSPLHLPQSPLDRACGIHSLLIAIALITRAPRISLENVAEATRGQWRAFWGSARGQYFDGSSPRDLERCAEHVVGVTTKRLRIDSTVMLHAACLSAIEHGAVPLLDLHGPNIAHWAVALGVESSFGVPSAILCLDPSATAPRNSFANARLDLGAMHQPARGKPLNSYRDIEGRTKHARVRSVLIVEPAE